MEKVSFPELLKRYFRQLADLRDDIDTDAAARQIQNGIWFKGPNVWILAFSIIIASVGLNVNSTAVIIGAMLVSPLMGPIIGIGLSIGTEDIDLLKKAATNLLVMVVISLLFSTLYFLISPLNQTNSELMARTSPTIYDVMIAFFGGCAGIVENARKEKGTALSGVAIATALMPPLCTAGFGLAHLNFHFFFGAMYLFLINCIFITLSTFIFVKYLRFTKHPDGDFLRNEHRRRVVTLLLIAFIVPSVISASSMIRDTNFAQKADAFVNENRFIGKTYIYDYTVTKGRQRRVELQLAGKMVEKGEREEILAAARKHGIKENQIEISQHALGLTRDDLDEFASSIYSKLTVSIEKSDSTIAALQTQLDSVLTLLSVLESRDTTLFDSDAKTDSLSDTSKALE